MLQSFYVPTVITHTRDDGTKNVFLCQEKLGQGGFAVVYKVKHQNTNKIYAMKIISKQYILRAKGESSLEKLKKEIQIQKSLNHPNIVQSKISFFDEFNYYIALEYCPGKTIGEYLRNNVNGYLSETETRKILRDVINGLIYIHNRKIVHKDLKLENFIIGSDGRVKIADFGLAYFIKDEKDKKNTSICGTPNYMSPETLNKKDSGNGYASDVWAIGVSAFIMLTGKPPFAGAYKDATYENIKNCQFTFPFNVTISHDAKDFVKSILKLDPTKRPTAHDLLKHPFMTKHDMEQISLYQKVQSPTKYQSPRFNFDIKDEDEQMSPPPQYYSPNAILSPISNDINQDPFKKLIFNSPVNNKNLIQQKPNNNNNKKTFTIPGNFVVKHSFLRDDLVYLLGNGTVGICFGDKSRIVLDPNEHFAQYYKSHISPMEIFDFNVHKEISSKMDEKISLLKNFARAFKKFKNLYDQSSKNTTSSIPLHHVSSFFKKDNAVLCKFSNKNVQVNFDDGKKLIIFWNSKKMCISKSIKEKCILFNQNDISKMNANSDEKKKFKKTKEMLNELARIR